jgi:hypothetical protein
MANTYIINPPLSVGDALYVSGTVNGVPVSVATWVSVAGNALASVLGWQNFATSLMLEAYNRIMQTAYPGLGSNPITVTK